MHVRRTITTLATAAVMLAACGEENRQEEAVATVETSPTSKSAPTTTGTAPTPDEPNSQATTGPSLDDTSPEDTSLADASTGGASTGDVASLQGMLDVWRAEAGADGATLSIRTLDGDDVALVSGIDDRDPDTAMPADGTFYAASVVKTFVTAITLQLVNEGRLSLGDTVETWLPELPSADRTTVAMLLDQTAGLADWQPDVLADLTRRYDGAELLGHDVMEPPNGAPGERFTYSNANFTAAALLLERELGMTLADIVEERLTSPLALDDTQIADGSIRPTRHGWFSLNGEPTHPQDNLDFPHEAALTSLWGAGDLLTSSEDLLTWGEALYSGQLLGPNLTNEMVRMRNSFELSGPDNVYTGTAEPTPLHYGLGTMGFCLEQTGCSPQTVNLVGHGGSIPGSRALVAHDLAMGTTIAVHANTDDIPLPALAAFAADVMLALGAT
jgi:D-alanyl-D-alanine carboxypeptidase